MMLKSRKRLYFLAGQASGFPRLTAYESLIRVLKSQRKEEDAFYFSEYTRARVLTEAIGGVVLGVVSVTPVESGKSVRLSRVMALSGGEVFAPAFFTLLGKSLYENYGPEKEAQAKRAAAEYLKKAGYDPRASEAILKKVQILKERGLTGHLISQNAGEGANK